MSQREPSGWAIGWTFFAAFMMIMMGCFHVLQGFAAILKNDTFVLTTPEYIFKFNVNAWGWIHLLVGVLVLLAGFGLFTGAVWARTVGVIMALIASLIGFAWIPYYPFGGLIMVAISIFVIWALTVHGRDVEQAEG